jgi:hypothetical protein
VHGVKHWTCQTLSKSNTTFDIHSPASWFGGQDAGARLQATGDKFAIYYHHAANHAAVQRSHVDLLGRRIVIQLVRMCVSCSRGLHPGQTQVILPKRNADYCNTAVQFKVVRPYNSIPFVIYSKSFGDFRCTAHQSARSRGWTRN